MKLFRLKPLFLGILLWVAMLLGVASPVLSSFFPPRIALIAQMSTPSSETQNTQPQDTSAETATKSTKYPSVKQESPTQTNPESPAPRNVQETNRTPSDRSYDLEAIQKFNRDVYGTP